MATPQFILTLREKIGNDLLFMPGVTAVVLRIPDDQPPAGRVPEVLMVKRADNRQWTPVTGICEPGEEPHITAEREVLEETGVEARVEAIIGTGIAGPTTYANGDQAQYVNIVYRLAVTGNMTPRVNDDESTEVGWFSIAKLPAVAPKWRMMIGDAAAQRRHPADYKQRFGFVKHAESGR
ncbi:MAG: NUDIX domain-containing protein [Corynebacterium sp.]|nr:NUDIX domain-containing protein [Corynebacterium sp.]